MKTWMYGAVCVAMGMVLMGELQNLVPLRAESLVTAVLCGLIIGVATVRAR